MGRTKKCTPWPYFTLFPKLPKELRCMIWARASPLRPRVIQVFYELSTETWQACADGCGGLPPIIHVSQEARKEALKGYTWAFDTYVDLEEDTIFINDPVFALRKPLRAFLKAEYRSRLRNLAITNDLYEGMEMSAAEFTTLCPRPTDVLRKLEGLTHFTLAISEDGELGIYDETTDDSDDGHDVANGDELNLDSEVEDIDVGLGPNPAEDTHLDGAIGITGAESQNTEQTQLRRRLAWLEKNAITNMSRGYVHHTGNIHFESAMESADHWDDWDFCKALIADHYDAEKARHPDWVRPKVSIMVLKYGLNRLGDFEGPIHLPGDHNGIEVEDSEFPPVASDSDSMTETDRFGYDWDGDGDGDYIEMMEEYGREEYGPIWEL